jgi:hypothetical protein
MWMGTPGRVCEAGVEQSNRPQMIRHSGLGLSIIHGLYRRDAAESRSSCNGTVTQRSRLQRV